MSVDALAEAVGLHASTTREHLDCLIRAGLASRHPEVRCTRGRPRMLYSAVARADTEASEAKVRAEMARLLIAGYGHGAESPTTAAEQAGFEWGVRLSGDGEDPAWRAWARATTGRPGASVQLAALETHLGALGFEPETDPQALEVRLNRCPYHELAHECPTVVCAVLLGVSRGVLTGVGGPLTVARLEAFAGPRPCTLHLADGGEPAQNRTLALAAD